MIARHLRSAALAAMGAVGGAGAIAGASWLLAGYVVHEITHPTEHKKPVLEFTPFETGVAWEPIRFPTEGNATLGGWLLVQPQPAPVVLTCVGYRGRRSDLLGIGSALWRAGFNVLLFDYRSSGEQTGPVTLGYRERIDAQAALQYLRERFPGAPLGVIGFSMGASVAIMLAAREPDVRCVVADSPFASQREIVRYQVAMYFKRRPSTSTAPAAALLLSLVDRRLHDQFGFGFADVRPIDDAQRLAPRPLLLIHGGDDETIPMEHSSRIADAAHDAGVPVDLWLVPSVHHCGAYFKDRPEYCDRIASFFHQHLDQQNG